MAIPLPPFASVGGILPRNGQKRQMYGKVVSKAFRRPGGEESRGISPSAGRSQSWSRLDEREALRIFPFTRGCATYSSRPPEGTRDGQSTILERIRDENWERPHLLPWGGQARALTRRHRELATHPPREVGGPEDFFPGHFRSFPLMAALAGRGTSRWYEGGLRRIQQPFWYENGRSLGCHAKGLHPALPNTRSLHNTMIARDQPRPQRRTVINLPCRAEDLLWGQPEV